MEKRRQILLPAVFITAIVFAGLFFHFLQQYIEEQYASNEVYNQQKIEYMNAHSHIQGDRYFSVFPPTSKQSAEKGEIPIKKDCSNSENEKRICADGALIPMYRSGCFATFCQEGSGEGEVIYYSPYVQKEGGVFIEEDHGYYNLNLAPIADADLATFRTIGICKSVGRVSRTFYGQDKNHVYVNDGPVDGIDAPSFQYLGIFGTGDGLPTDISISVDKNTVYLGCGEIVASVDRKSFEFLGNGYFRDNKNVYYIDHVVGGADHDTFESLNYKKTYESKIYGNFAIDKDRVFFNGFPMKELSPVICKEKGIEICLPTNWDNLVDRSVSPVKIFNDQLAKKQESSAKSACSNNESEKRICPNGALIPMYDMNEAGCVAMLCREGSGESEKSYYSPYVKKDRQIFIEGQYGRSLTPIAGADATTFRPVGACASVEMSRAHYGRDENHVYMNDIPMNDMDVRSFKYLGIFQNGEGVPYSTSVSTDKDTVYFGCGKAVASVDRKSFEVIDNGYFRDEKNTYYLNSIVSGADNRTFESIDYEWTNKINGNFAQDKDRVFFEGYPMKGIDPATCKEKGLENCLPENWRDLIDTSTPPERLWEL